MAWTFIGRLVPEKIRFLGIEPLFKFSQLRNDWDEIMERVAGNNFKNKSKLNNLRKGVLMVDCLNSVWANELRLRENRILEEIKRKNRQVRIEKIVFIC